MSVSRYQTLAPTVKTTPNPNLNYTPLPSKVAQSRAAGLAKFGVVEDGGSVGMSIPTALTVPGGGQFKSAQVTDNFQSPRIEFSKETRQSYAGTKPLTDIFGNRAGELNHIVPLELGGTNDPKNLDWRMNKRSLLEMVTKKDVSFTKGQQEGRTLVEVANIKDWKDGKISQEQAITNILAWDEAQKNKGITGVMNNLKKAAPLAWQQIKDQAKDIKNRFTPTDEVYKMAEALDNNKTFQSVAGAADKTFKTVNNAISEATGAVGGACTASIKKALDLPSEIMQGKSIQDIGRQWVTLS